EFVTGERSFSLTAGPALRAIQRELQLRRRKEDVFAEMPPKTLLDVAVELTPWQRASYERLEHAGKRRLRDLGDDVTTTHVLSLMRRLKQVCNFCPATGASSKREFVSERLAEIVQNDRRALIFSQYTDERVGLRRLAAELGEPVGLFHGGMTPRERE